MYDEPCEEKPCSECEFMNYDSFHDDKWCSHEPLAEGIGWRSQIDKWGTCEYWAKSKY